MKGAHAHRLYTKCLNTCWASLHEMKAKADKHMPVFSSPQSELPFRMLCRRNGSTAAYTPMMHARLFAEDPKYRQGHMLARAHEVALSSTITLFQANSEATVLVHVHIVF
eukprot:1160781-Pelagomonas_calceolata.AAC.19